MKDTVSKPLDESIIQNWSNFRSKAYVLEEEIIDRITHIIEVWFEAFGGSLSTWYFDDAAEGTVGDLQRYMDNSSISCIHTDAKRDLKPNCGYEMVIIDKFGKEYSWQSEVLTRWLFEDFEQEIINGKKAFDDAEAGRKEKAKQAKVKKRESDQVLASKALAKLTKEELAALKRTL